MKVISIVTVVFNNAKGLEKTIISVLEQSYKNYEYIIVDGGSTDGTLDVIKKYSENIDLWISEPDRGIYDAMNKGVKSSNGEYLYFLNSGDFFCGKDVLESVTKHISHGTPSLVSGNVIRLYDNFEHTFKPDMKKLEWGRMIPHQGAFVKRSIFNELGEYDISYLSSGDMDFFCRFYKAGYNYKEIDENVAFMPSGGFSSNKAVSLPETYILIKHHFGLLRALRYYSKVILFEQSIKKILLGLGLDNVYKKLLYSRMKRSESRGAP